MDLANDYLVQVLESVYLCIQRMGLFQCHVFAQRLLTLLSVSNYGAWWGTIAESTGNHRFNLKPKCCSCQSYD